MRDREVWFVVIHGVTKSRTGHSTRTTSLLKQCFVVVVVCFVFLISSLIYFQLCWTCVATHKLALVVASEGYSVVMVHELFIAECRMLLTVLSCCRAWAVDMQASVAAVPGP